MYDGVAVRDERGVEVCPRCRRPCLPGIPWIRQRIPARVEAEIRELLREDQAT
jgi:hypothetical protein